MVRRGRGSGGSGCGSGPGAATAAAAPQGHREVAENKLKKIGFFDVSDIFGISGRFQAFSHVFGRFQVLSDVFS